MTQTRKMTFKHVYYQKCTSGVYSYGSLFIGKSRVATDVSKGMAELIMRRYNHPFFRKKKQQ
jgi:hypothetical protein